MHGICRRTDVPRVSRHGHIPATGIPAPASSTHRVTRIPGMKPPERQAGPLVWHRPAPGLPWSRRDVLKAGMGSLVWGAIAPGFGLGSRPGFADRPVVGIVRVRNDGIARAVEEVLELIGGVEHVTAGKQRILLKPNLVAEGPTYTTRPEVVRALATLMQRAGKEVSIGEGSAAGTGFNLRDGVQYRTRSRAILDPMQQFVFDRLGYTDLARELHVPLLNLHSGELVEVPLAHGYVFDHLTLHRALLDTDLLVSVPIMKTHSLAGVTLGMKNLIGLYPGTIYYSVRSWLHERAAGAGSPGVAYETVDMVRANKLGLTVIDASRAMEGDGPSSGDVVDMGLLIAGTNPLATDMVGAAAMGFAPAEIPTFAAALQAGMTPAALDDIEIRGAPLATVRRRFKRPHIYRWSDIGGFWGVKELPDVTPTRHD